MHIPNVIAPPQEEQRVIVIKNIQYIRNNNEEPLEISRSRNFLGLDTNIGGGIWRDRENEKRTHVMLRSEKSPSSSRDDDDDE